MEKINELITWVQNIELNQIINLIIAIVAIILTVTFSSGISYIITKIFNFKKKKEEIIKTVMYSIVRSLIIVSGIYLSTKILNLNEEIQAFIWKIYRISLMWIIAKTISELLIKVKIFKTVIKDRENDPMINIINRIIKVVIYIIAGYLTLKEFGYDLGVILTGLGLSTAIIALAAQDAVRDMFSGLAIFWDKPFAIGDWVEIGTATNTVSGSVEQISFRSTKIRTVEDTIITIQNSNISTQNIINWGVIKKRVYKVNLKLPLETEEVVVEKVINRIRFILKYNKDVIKESISVYFNSIQNDGINIYIYLETPITVFSEYQKFCNKLNLTILNILENQDVKLAYPGQNIYIKSIENGNENTNKNTNTNKNVNINKHEIIEEAKGKIKAKSHIKATKIEK